MRALKKLISENKNHDAIDFSTDIISRYPTHVEAYRDRSHVYKRLGMHKKALEDYDNIIEIDQHNVANYYLRAHCKVSMKDFRGAAKDYSRCIALENLSTDRYFHESSHFCRGYCNFMLGERSQCLKDLSSVSAGFLVWIGGEKLTKEILAERAEGS